MPSIVLIVNVKRELIMINLREACEEYIDLLNSPPNGWGQHVHPIYGQSHNLLFKLWKDWSKKEVEDCLQMIFEERENQ